MAARSGLVHLVESTALAATRCHPEAMGVLGLRRPVLRSSQVVWGAVAISVAARLPLIDLPAWPDEAGLLTVGRGWGLGPGADGRSLYGDHWVDRPPLLVTIYGLAERLGGLTAYRSLVGLRTGGGQQCVPPCSRPADHGIRRLISVGDLVVERAIGSVAFETRLSSVCSRSDRVSKGFVIEIARRSHGEP